MKIYKPLFRYIPPALTVVGFAITVVSCQPTPPADPTSILLSPEPETAQFEIPYEMVSQESLFTYLEALTSIQAYSGWRTAATAGEVEAFDYVEAQLNQFEALQAWGLELERQSFNVFITTEIWEARLQLTTKDGQEIEVPANGLRGSRYDPDLTMAFDSDGEINDVNANPLSASGTPLLVRNAKQLYALKDEEIQGHVLFFDSALIDSYASSNYREIGSQLMQVIDRGIAGLVLVTEFHNQAGKSHGTVIGDGTFFQYLIPGAHVPILYARLEDLAPAGVQDWEDIERIQSATVILDADVISPATSGNLIARIPGTDSTRAMILGAHIDSPNSPGAFDDGSGSVVLLEVARVLNQAQVQPPVDLYLAWFGSHENGIYGSAHFAATHQELLDNAIALLQVDCLGHPLDGNTSEIVMNLTSYGLFGDGNLPWPDFLAKIGETQGINLEPYVEYGLIADNSNFDAFNLPNLDLIYLNPQELENMGSGYIHYSGHLHDPYETVELAREVGDVLEEMAKVALGAALETGRSQPELRIPTPPAKRALLVASHTEPVSMATTVTRELGMALAMEGFDVDLIPYEHFLAQSDLENVGVVILLPTLDYPGTHEEIWKEEELKILDQYISEGGFLIVTNSAGSFAMTRPLDDENEDTLDFNSLLSPAGIEFKTGKIRGDIAMPVSEHSLTDGIGYMTLYAGNGVPFEMNEGQELFEVNRHAIVGLASYGDQGGEVLVVADISLLFDNSGDANNLAFVKNIASYAHIR